MDEVAVKTDGEDGRVPLFARMWGITQAEAQELLEAVQMDLDRATDAWIHAAGQLAADRVKGEQLPRSTQLAIALRYAVGHGKSVPALVSPQARTTANRSRFSFEYPEHAIMMLSRSDSPAEAHLI